MDRWSEFEEHFSRWRREEALLRAHRRLTRQTVEVVQEIAAARRDIARIYGDRADGASVKDAPYLRARARRFDELADRATRFAEAEDQEASRD